LAARRSGPAWLGRFSKSNRKEIQAKPEGNPSILLPRIERFQRVALDAEPKIFAGPVLDENAGKSMPAHV
jgi:hypothetical protein